MRPDSNEGPPPQHVLLYVENPLGKDSRIPTGAALQSIVNYAVDAKWSSGPPGLEQPCLFVLEPTSVKAILCESEVLKIVLDDGQGASEVPRVQAAVRDLSIACHEPYVELVIEMTTDDDAAHTAVTSFVLSAMEVYRDPCIPPSLLWTCV